MEELLGQRSIHMSKKNKKREAITLEVLGSIIDGSFGIATGVPAPVSSIVTVVHAFIKSDSLRAAYPKLDQLRGYDANKIALYIAEKLETDFQYSIIGDKAKSLRARELSAKRFEHLFADEMIKDPIYLPVTSDEMDAGPETNAESLRAHLQSKEFTNECEKLVSRIKRRRQNLNVSVCSVCVSSVAVLLSLKNRFGLNITISNYSANAKLQLESIVQSNQKNLDYIITANPTFTFHSNDLLGVKNFSLLREVHYEIQHLMFRRSRIFRIARPGREIIATYDKSTALEQFVLDFKKDFKIAKIKDFEEYPPKDINQALAWEPLAFHLGKIGWKKNSGPPYEIIFSIFGNDQRKDSLNRDFIKLFSLEWMFCRYSQELAYEMLTENLEFMTAFAKGCGSYDADI